MKRSRHSRAIHGLLALVTLILVFGGVLACARPSAPVPEPTPAPVPEPTVTPEPAEETLDVPVCLVREERLGMSTRTVTFTEAVAAEAMRQLLQGATAEEIEAGLHSEIPAGTSLLGVEIDSGVATVDLSKEFESGGGSLSMQLRVAQVVYTLTAFPTVDSVAFKIDGQQVEAIGGEGVMVSPSVSRADFADNTVPPIFLEEPTPWRDVTSPLRISGLSNTFEATVLYEVVDPSGRIVAEGFTTASAGSGEWGTFEETIEYEIRYDGVGALIVFEESAQDGSRVNLVEIPLRMRQ